MDTKGIALDQTVLADLITELYSKACSGLISVERLAWFVKQDDETLETLDSSIELQKKFGYLIDKFEFVGMKADLIVPDSYGTYQYLNILPDNLKKKYLINGKLIDENNFGKASSKISPGEKLDLYIYKLRKGKIISSVGLTLFHMFLKDSLMLGFHGVPIIFPTHKNLIESECVYHSFDYLDNLFAREDSGDIVVNSIFLESGNHVVSARSFLDPWSNEEHFFIFKKAKH